MSGNIAIRLWGALGTDAALPRDTLVEVLNAIEHFKQDHESNVPPGAKIKLESVRGGPQGRIIYTTEDGTKWAVEANKQNDETYKYGFPELIGKE